ncbi:MAG: hypothetical protein PHF29_08370 [Candidatus Riflebacteria bacterium]|nr:hypothetical protein [Candidatus Riflebacteria bacterium]
MAAITVTDIKTKIDAQKAEILAEKGKENIRVEELDRLYTYIDLNEEKTYASTVAKVFNIEVPNGTLEAAAIALIDDEVNVLNTLAQTGTATVAWTIAAYNAAVAGDYTATGVVTLPVNWVGAVANLTATVTVLAA